MPTKTDPMKNLTSSKQTMNQPDYKVLMTKARIALGETQEEFGKRFGLSAMAISHYELGTRQPHKDIVYFLGQFTAHAKVCDKCGGSGWIGIDSLIIKPKTKRRDENI